MREREAPRTALSLDARDSKELYVLRAREQWAALVHLAFCGYNVETLAAETSTNLALLKRKFAAIQYTHESGWEEIAIVALGQRGTLSAYAKSKKRRFGKEKVLRWRVSAGLADCIQNKNASEDSEEPLVTRLHRLLGFLTSEELWMYLHAHFANFSDGDIQHDAGELTERGLRRGRRL